VIVFIGGNCIRALPVFVSAREEEGMAIELSGYAEFAEKKPVVADQTLFRPGFIAMVFIPTAVACRKAYKKTAGMEIFSLFLEKNKKNASDSSSCYEEITTSE
jgi:hypothetical protein